MKSDPNDLLVYMRVAMNHLHNRAERTAYMWEGEDHLYIQEKEKKPLAHIEEEPIKDKTLSKKVRMKYPSLMQMVKADPS